MKKHRIIAIVTIAVGCLSATIISSLLAFSSTVFADASIETKVLYNGLSACYGSNQLKSEVNNTGTFTYGAISSNSGAGIVTLPTYNNNKSKLDINCYQLFSRLLGSRKTTPEQLGYKPSGDVKNNIKCMSVKYSYAPDGLNVSSDKQEADQVCFPVDDKNNVAITNANNDVTITSSGSNTIFRLRSEPNGTSANIIGYSTYCNNIDNSNGSPFAATVLQLTNGLSAQTIETELASRLNDGLNCIKNGNFIPLSDFTVKVNPKSGSGQTSSDKYTIDKQGGALTALRYISNTNNNFSNYTISDNDYYLLYKSYISHVAQTYPGTVTITNNCSTDKNAFTYAWTSDKTNWCEVKISGDVSEWFGGRPSSGWESHMTPMQFRDILTSAKNIDLGNVDSSSLGTISGQPGPGDDTPGGDDSEGEDGNNESGLAVCYEGTGVLGWIACPVIELVGNATGYLYEHWIEPSLQIQAGQFMKRDSAVYGAWDTFRGFANTLFAVAFAVIILAQLTGIGISNYNIKKMLPRLIMVAVLVNISFVLCQVVVDLSNILGVALKDLFLGLAGKAGADLGANGFFVTTVKELTLGLAVVGGTAAILGGTVAIATLKYWIVPILLSLLSCLVAILFFFILLGVRQAGVIILVVLTPLAIVCYALPNTKSFFDRWKKMFTSLLVLYPICGAMMGACEYAATILTQISQEGSEVKVGFTLVAMLVDVVPFFFIPSLVKSSMVAMGNLGAKISNFGNGIGRGLTGGIRKSRAFQDHQAEAQRQLNYERDTRTADKLSRRAEGKGLVARGRKLLSRAPITGRFVREGLTSGEVLRAARAASGISQSTDTTAQAMLTRMNSDGSINNIGDLSTEGTDREAPDFQGSLVARYRAASRRLFKDPTDRDALEEKKAVSMALAKSKTGLEQLRLANSQLISEVAAMPEGDKKQIEDKRRAKQVLQQTVNDLRRTNGGDIAKSTMLDEQMTLMGNIGANYDTIDSEALTSSIGKLSPKNVSNVPKQDLRAYQQAMASGKLDAKAYNKLSDAMIGALSDPRYSGSIEADAMPLVQTLADNKYTRKPAPHATQAEIENAQSENINAMSKADDVELSRIHNRVRSRSMDPGAQADLMSTMGQTLVRSLEPNSGIKLSANQATQMTKILQEGGYDLNSLAQQHGMTDASQLQERLDISTGMKVPRAPRMSGLRDHPQQWRQATAADVAATHGQLDGSRLRVGDWVKNEELSGPPTADGRAPTRMVRMSPTEVRAAEMLQSREAESLLQQSDESFASRQAWQNQQNQYSQQSQQNNQNNQSSQQQGGQQGGQNNQGSQQQGDQQRRQRSDGGRQSSDQDNRRGSDGRQGQRDGSQP